MLFFRSRFLLVLIVPVLMAGQALPVKTIPLLTMEQFIMTPSYRVGMGGVSIAVDDELGDAFANPARMPALDKNLYFLAPRYNGWTLSQLPRLFFPVLEPIANMEGGFRSSSLVAIPAGVLKQSGPEAGLKSAVALSVAPEWLRYDDGGTLFGSGLHFNALNLPFMALAAGKVPWTDFFIGCGLSGVLVKGVDGVGMLYPGALSLEQSGYVLNSRVGLYRHGRRGGQLDMLVAGHSFGVQHKAKYDDGGSASNKDTNYGLKAAAAYDRPLGGGYRAGMAMEWSWRYHPKIPDYPLSGVPRDPGITRALDMGLGLSWLDDETLMAIDAIFERVDGRTWVAAETSTERDDGSNIPRGEPVLWNNYLFTNGLLRLGVETRLREDLRVQLGSQIRTYRVDYTRKDEITGDSLFVKRQGQWAELVLTGGAVLTREPWEWIYSLQVVNGNGIPGRTGWWWMPRLNGTKFAYADAFGADFYIPPLGVGIEPVPVLMHQVTLVYWF